MLQLFLVTLLFANSNFVSSANVGSSNLNKVGSSNLRGSVDEYDSDQKEFSLFRKRFNKVYDSDEDFFSHFNVFKSNVRSIIEHNSIIEKNFTLGINQFSDLTAEEFKALYINSGYKGATVGSYGCKTYTSAATSAPASIDWRQKNAVTSVKDQGQCGSCWTFSSTGASEGAWAISTGKLIDLSEQQLVDCATGVSYGSHGCNGGQMEGADKYLIANGQCSLASYPYTATDDKCRTCSPVAHFSSCSDVKPNDQISLLNAVAMQPVSVAIEADTRYFQSYTGGILDATTCGTTLDHGVLIVGYGTDNGKKYWNVKNSWSSSWGEQGYVRILRSDSTNDAGICGIAMDPSFISV
jgi:KDEL-tailed cysteine endopeptidase